MKKNCDQDQILSSSVQGSLLQYISAITCSLSVFDLRDNLNGICEKLLQKEFGVTSKVSFDIPSTPDRGDLTTSFALQLSKQLKVSPQELAKKFTSAIEKVDGVESCEVVGPGYINVRLTSDVLFKALEKVWERGESEKTRKKEAPVIVEYSDPNIAKPLGIHHILATVIGQSIANLHRHLGYNTIAINHIGDWGTQFGQLAVAHATWGTKPVKECSIDDLLALYVKFHEEMEKDKALEEEGREAFRKLEAGDKELQKFWKETVAITMKAMESIYERLHVSFDHVQGESFYQDKVGAVMDEGKKKGVFKEGEAGALIVTYPEESNLPPAVVVKGDGATLYMTRDLATVKYRLDTWKPQAILYVVDVAQQLYFKQVFAAVEQLQWDDSPLEHVVFGRMRFADKSMSTRKGNILKLEDVLDESVKRAHNLIDEKSSELEKAERDDLADMIGTGAVVYGILSQNRKMDIVFDWQKVLTFEGNSAPYLQYTHARGASVLRKADAEETPDFQSLVCKSITESERALIHQLLKFQDVLLLACRERMPHRLCNYLYELCQAYNAFYNADVILQAPEPLRTCRLALTSLSVRVLKTGADILTLRVPQRM